ncbi:MAG: hypothetical protein ACXABO_16160 [Promethearchaeota archaeon]|jgi:hypothetical protein
MKKKTYFAYFSLMVILLFTFSYKSVIASDDDDDGVNDEFEELNSREVNVEVNENEAQIESHLLNGDSLDELHFKIQSNEEGIGIEFSYESDYNSGSELELEFGIRFHEIIEYIDTDDNGVYNKDIDLQLQKYLINDSKPIIYSSSIISVGRYLHYLRIETNDSIFKLHIYVTEEFFKVNDTLITPNQMKIDVEINNFNYINSGSRLALYALLESELEFEEDEETEDEDSGYSTNEEGVITTINQFTGYFSWQENATIDGKTREVLVNSLEVDDHDEDEQKIYLNYKQGEKIFHDPKIGVEGLWRIILTPFPLTTIIIIALIITFVSASIAYTVYHYKHNEPIRHSRKIQVKDKIKAYTDLETESLVSNESILQLFEDKNGLENLLKLKDANITALSDEFFDKVDYIDWDSNEKAEFISEVLSLTPDERDSILDKMLKKLNRTNEKNY